jgi:thiol-disulfide isomerase/thioredoxin
MPYSFFIYLLFFLLPGKNEKCSYFQNENFAQLVDSIEIFNKTNQDILCVVDGTFNSEPLPLRKRTITKFKPLEKSVLLVQSSRCIYSLTNGKRYTIEEVINGISRIRCTNPNYEEDKELGFFPACTDSFDVLPPIFFSGPKKFESIAFRDKMIENDFNKQITFLNRYIQKYNLSGKFYKQCEYLFKIAKYARKTQLFEKAKNIKELKDSINVWREETYQYYKDSLFSYLSVLSAKGGNFDVVEKDLIANTEILLLHDCFKEEKFNSDNLEFFQIKQKKLSGFYPQTIADFVLTDNILTCINYGHIVSDSFWDEYKSLCKNEIYKNYVEKILLQKKVASNYNNSPDFLLMNMNGNHLWWKRILESHKGRYVYLDFWASWCVPCRAEIPFSKKLASELGQKNIDFIFLSIDENKNSWKEAVKQENLQDSSKSFLIINPKGKYNYQYYKVNEIPRYIIFDKEGRVIDFNAPRPSEKKTKNKLLALFNQ